MSRLATSQDEANADMLFRIHLLLKFIPDDSHIRRPPVAAGELDTAANPHDAIGRIRFVHALRVGAPPAVRIQPPLDASGDGMGYTHDLWCHSRRPRQHNTNVHTRLPSAHITSPIARRMIIRLESSQATRPGVFGLPPPRRRGHLKGGGSTRRPTRHSSSSIHYFVAMSNHMAMQHLHNFRTISSYHIYARHTLSLRFWANDMVQWKHQDKEELR